MGGAQVPLGVTKESYWMTIDKFKAIDFKKYVARYQVSYIYKVIGKPSSILILESSTRIKEISKLLE